MRPENNNRPLKSSLKDQERKFKDLLREKEIAAKARARIGYKMSDGTIYAGISPETGQPMYVMPADGLRTMTFNEVDDYAERLNQEKYLGHSDWRVPTKNELGVLFNNRAAIGGFNQGGAPSAGWYWSSSDIDPRIAWVQRFSDGFQNYYPKTILVSVRLVRRAPKVKSKSDPGHDAAIY